jgi:hypothetical protein
MLSPWDLFLRAFAIGAGWYAAYLLFCMIEALLIPDDEDAP